MKKLLSIFILVSTILINGLQSVNAAETYHFSFYGTLRTIKVDSDKDLPDPYVFVEDMVEDNDGFFISSSNSVYMMNLVHTYDEEVSKDTVVKYLRHYTIEDFKDNDQTVTYTITQDILKKVGGPVYEIRMESEYIKLYHSTAKISDYTHGILDDDSDVDYGYNVFSNDAYIKKYLEEFFPQMCNVLDAACNDPSATESITYTDVEVATGIAPSNCYNVIRRTHYVDRVLDGKTYRFVAVLNIRLLHHNYAITYSGQMDTLKVKEGNSLPLPYNSINKLISSNPSFNLDAFMTNKLAISFVKDVESGAQEGIKIYTRTYKIYDKCEPKISVTVNQPICVLGTVNLGSSTYNTQLYHKDTDLSDYNGGSMYNQASILAYLKSYFPGGFNMLKTKCPSGDETLTYTEQIVSTGECSSVLKRTHVISKVNSKGVTYTYTAIVNFTIKHNNESIVLAGALQDIEYDIDKYSFNGKLPEPYHSVAEMIVNNHGFNVQCLNVDNLIISSSDQLIGNEQTDDVKKKIYERTYVISDKCDATITASIVQRIVLFDIGVFWYEYGTDIVIYHEDADITDYEGGELYRESEIWSYLNSKFPDYETEIDNKITELSEQMGDLENCPNELKLSYTETTSTSDDCSTVIQREHNIDRICGGHLFRYVAYVDIVVRHFNKELEVTGTMETLEEDVDNIEEVSKYATIQELMDANPGLNILVDKTKNTLDVIFKDDVLSDEDDCSKTYSRRYQIVDKCTLEDNNQFNDLYKYVYQTIKIKNNPIKILNRNLEPFRFDLCDGEAPTDEHANLEYLESKGLVLDPSVDKNDITITYYDLEDEVYPYYFTRVFYLKSNKCPDVEESIIQDYIPDFIYCYDEEIPQDEYEICSKEDLDATLPQNKAEALAYLQYLVDEGWLYPEAYDDLTFNYPPFNEYPGTLSCIAYNHRAGEDPPLDECRIPYLMVIEFNYDYKGRTYKSEWTAGIDARPYEQKPGETHPHKEITIPNDTIFGCALESCLPPPLKTIDDFAEKEIEIPQVCDDDDLVDVDFDEILLESDDCMKRYLRKYWVKEKCRGYEWYYIEHTIILYNNLDVEGPLNTHVYNVYDSDCDNSEQRPKVASIDYLLGKGLKIKNPGVNPEDVIITYEDKDDEKYPFYFEREYTLTYTKCPDKEVEITQQFEPKVVYYYDAWENGDEAYVYNVCKDDIDSYVPESNYTSAVEYINNYPYDTELTQDDINGLLFNYPPFNEYDGGDISAKVESSKVSKKGGCETELDIEITFYYEYYGRIYESKFFDYLILHHYDKDEHDFKMQTFELPEITIENCKTDDCLPEAMSTIEEFAEQGITIEQTCNDDGLLKFEVDDKKEEDGGLDCMDRYTRTYKIYCKCTNHLKYTITQKINVETNLEVYGYLPTIYYEEDMPDAETDLGVLKSNGLKFDYSGKNSDLVVYSKDFEMEIPNRTERRYYLSSSCKSVIDSLTQYLVKFSPEWSEFEVMEVNNVSIGDAADGSIVMRIPQDDQLEEGQTVFDAYEITLIDQSNNEYTFEPEAENHLIAKNLPAGNYILEVFPTDFDKKEPVYKYMGKITELKMDVAAMPAMSLSSYNFYVLTFGHHYVYGNDTETGQSVITQIQNDNDPDWNYYFTVEGGKLLSSVWDGGESFKFYPSIQSNFETNSLYWRPEETIQLTMNSLYITFHALHKSGKELKDKRIIYRSKICYSNDPNEIYGPVGYGDDKMISSNDRIEYKIMFENDPDLATAAAARVKITCPLHPHADSTTVSIGQYGFGDYIFEVPSMSNHYSKRHDLADSLGIWLDVTAGIDVEKNEMYWIFQSIDPETGVAPTDAIGFLPVNDTLTGCGEGFVTFSVISIDGMKTGDTISEQADIVFDENDDILTNVYTNMFDAVAPTSISVCDSSGVLLDYNLIFKSVATDDENGSGIRQVDLYVNIDSTRYELAGSMFPDSLNSADTMSFQYRLGEGSLYQFMFQAVDNVGNKEPFPNTPQISYVNNNPPLDIYLSNRYFYEDDEIGTVIGEFTTIDDQSSDAFTYSLVDEEGYDNDIFIIDGKQLILNKDLRCYGQYMFQILVRTTDVNGDSYNKAFILYAEQTMTPPTTLVDHYLCYGDFVEIAGKDISEDGYYYDTIPTPYGCDSIVKHIVKHRPEPVITTYDELICMYQDYDNYGINVTWDSIYERLAGWNELYDTTLVLVRDTVNLYGCADTIKVNLTVKPASRSTQNFVVCADALPFVYGDSIFIESGTKDVYFTSKLTGCDSIVTVNFEVAPTYFDVPVFATICDNQYYMLFDDTIREAGTYYKMGESSYGCDSSVYLKLEVLPVSIGVGTLSICESELPYEYGEYTFEESTVSGTYEVVFPAANGCDSIVALDLTVRHDGSQGIDFSGTWDWFSTYIDDEHTDVFAELKEGLSGVGKTVKSNTSFVNYAGDVWSGLLDKIENEQMYMIQTTDPKQVDNCITGCVADPEEHPITIKKGWNHIGYISEYTSDVNDALAGLNVTPQDGDIIKSYRDGFAVYFESFGMWFGDLTMLQPGQGYQYLSFNNDDITLTYPQISQNRGERKSMLARNWTPSYKYPDNMTFIADIVVDDWVCDSDTLEVGAFCNGEQRGNARAIYIEELGTYRVFLTTYGKDGDELYFMLYDHESGEEAAQVSNQRVVFEVNATYGSLLTPYSFEFNTKYNTLIEDAICSGNSYNENGFEVDNAGSYFKTYKDENGNDSIVKLKLSVNPTYRLDENVMVKKFPYEYDGTWIEEPGVHTFNYTSVHGCDSIMVCSFMYETTELMLLPNPANKEDKVLMLYNFTEDEKSGLTVEVYNAVGLKILSVKPTRFPIELPEIDTSGSYVIRVITGTGRVLTSKLIIM